MNFTSLKFNFQVHLLPMIGPLIITLTLFMALIKSGFLLWPLPLAAAFGLLLCFQWHWRGFIASIALLAMLTAYHFTQNSFQDWVWVVAFSLSIAFALLLTVLTIAESHHKWDLLNRHSLEEKQTLIEVKEITKDAFKRHEAEKNALCMKVEALQSEVITYDEKLKAAESLKQIVRDELTTMHEAQEKLLQELYEERQKKTAYQVSLEPQVSLELFEQLQRTKEKNEADAGFKLSAMEREKANLMATKNAFEEMNARLKNELALIQEKVLQQLQKITGYEETIKSLQNKVEESHIKVAQEPENQDINNQEMNRLSGLYHQLKSQFQEKSLLLDKTRQELFFTEEKLLAHQREMEEEKMGDDRKLQLFFKDVVTSLEKENAALKREYEEEIQGLNEIITAVLGG